MSISRFAVGLSLALACLAAAGCDPMSRPPSGRVDPLPPQMYGRIQAIGSLDKHLFFGQPIVASADAENPMTIEIPVRSRASVPINTQYRFEFYDRHNQLLTKSDKWVYARLDPKIEFRLKGTGTHPDVVDWRLVIRPAE